VIVIVFVFVFSNYSRYKKKLGEIKRNKEKLLIPKGDIKKKFVVPIVIVLAISMSLLLLLLLIIIVIVMLIILIVINCDWY